MDSCLRRNDKDIRMKFKTRLRIKSLQYHQWLAWLAALALLLFGASGMLHPVMSWTGPRPAAFFPPQTTMKAEQAAAIPHVLAQYGITSPLLVKLVPSGENVLVQVTESANQPRRYFDPGTGGELEGHDMRHAIWLARYYSGLEQDDIASVDFQTEFDDAYPWVNRLLPVYRITFDTPDRRTVFVHTELNALAGLTNNWKTSLQTLFGIFHTWNFLNDMETLRVAAMLVLLVSLSAATLAGMVLIFTLNMRPNPSTSRRWHRRLAYGLWLPLLAFSASGSYHLVQYSYGESTRGLRMGKPLDLTGTPLANGAWMARYTDMPLNGVSLIKGENGVLYYRLGVPQGKATMPTQNQRYDGVPLEKTSLYIDAHTGEETSLSDKDVASLVARFYKSGMPQAVSSILRFSPEYDFRNKRLPAWKIDYPDGETLFVDPVGGLLIDRIHSAERFENYVFSIAHKWNFLADWTNRPLRDALVVAILLLALGMAAFGIRMKSPSSKAK